MVRAIKLTLEKDVPVQLCELNSGYSVLLKVDSKNVGQVFLGGSDVTPGNGYPLERGESLPLPRVNYSHLYVRSSAKNDVVYLLIW